MKHETLLNAFVFLSKYYGKDISKHSILAQLPKFDGDIPYEYIGRVSQKLHFESKIISLKIFNLEKEFLPVIAKTKNDRFHVVLEYDDKNFLLKSNALENGTQKVSREHFEEMFEHEVILIKPSFNFNKSNQRFKNLNPKSWFMDSLIFNKSLYSQLILTTIMINILILALPMFTLNVYDRVIPNNAIETLWVLTFAVVVALIIEFVLKMLRTYFLSHIGKKTDILVSINIFEHLMNLKLEQKPASTGIFSNTLASFEKVREFLTSATMVTIIDMPFALFFIVIIFMVGGELGYIPLLTAIIIILIALVSQQRLKPIVEESFYQSKLKHGNLVESVYGLESIKAIGATNRMYSRWETSIKETTQSNHKIHIESKLASTLISTVVQISSIALVALGSYMAIVDKSITMGVIIAAMILNSRAMSPIAQFVSILSQFNITLSSYKALDQFMKLDDDRYKQAKYIRIDENRGDMVLDSVSFRYPNAQFEILKNINLTIRSGEKIAILGKVGSGKSTLIKLLANLYEPTSGSLMLNDVDIRKIDSSDVRSLVSLIPQDVMLFSGNLRDNIALGYDAMSDKDIFEILDTVGLSTLVKRNKKGLEMEIGERGDGLSGGEKKSVTIARALASNTYVLLADEPTDSIDAQTERYIIEHIKKSIQDKTFVVVTHKPSILQLVDRVLVVEDGKIVLDGPKQEVLAKITKSKKAGDAYEA
jgi:ATP-binding cassette subfamily C protein LapB